MNVGEFSQRLLEAAKHLRAAEATYDECIREAAAAEKRYKRRQAIALIQVEGRNADERNANAELLEFKDGDTVGDMRYAAHLADGLRDSAKQALQNRRQELSALQSLAALSKEEAAFTRTYQDSA